MKEFISDLLNNRGGNYILPFFWQHGETEEVLRTYMKAIYDCGIGAVCVEARPHPDFVGPQWWHDMDIILDEARKRGMKVWILDDAHFPTGFAAGKLTDGDSQLCKQYIAVNRTEVCGPVPEATLDVGAMAKHRPNPFAGSNPFISGTPREFDDDELFAVVASKVVNSDTLSGETVDLTDCVKDGLLEWNVPDGVWRIFVVYKTRNGGGRTDYINMLDEASCRVQIDAVYEPHYAHYKDDFGKTIAGFFSDEPAVGNVGGFNFDESIGRKNMPLPWNKDMNHMLEERLGKDYRKYLPALWAPMDDEAVTGKVRYGYMDAATRLIARNFSEQIGGWCKDHGVEYIGHIIEDSNQHSRLGSSMGHFFRAMQGQHMSGIDDIGNQVIVGGEDSRRISPFGPGGEGEFFHFELGKLGSSFAHIDPKKQGRAMCEIYGAYGWNTGVRTMKYLTDHFLVRGINYYVPHAFSPKAFPDPDCPPHFYAHGENPQYRHFGKLMRYLNRMCHIFNNGLNVAPAAVLYHGEAEWSGGYMFDQKVSRQLLEHQIDFDILPSDLFADMDVFNASFDGNLHVNGVTYQTLIVPYAQFVTSAVAEFAGKAAADGFKVIFVDQLPSGIVDSGDKAENDRLMAGLTRCQAVPLGDLADWLLTAGVNEITVSKPFRRLRYYHYVHDGAHIYMFSNEAPSECFEGAVTVPVTGPVYGYDAMENQIYAPEVKADAHGTQIDLHLGAYESAVIIFDEPVDNIVKMPEGSGQLCPLEGGWTVSVCETKEYPDFKKAAQMDTLHNFGKIMPDFSGFIRYEKTFESKAAAGAVLEIANAYEGVEVWINDCYAGMKICPPYRFDISGLLKDGTNTVRIEVATTLYRRVKNIDQTPNFFGPQAIVMEPTGIVGDVAIRTFTD